MEYRRKNGRNCVEVALVNLLIFRGDYLAVRDVEANYSLSSLVREGGDTNPGLVTRLVRDITKGKYDALLHVDWGNDIREIIREYYPGNADHLVSIFEEETRKGNIHGDEEVIELSTYPYITFHDNSYGWSHAVVSLGNEQYLNDGEIIGKKEMKKLELNPNPVAYLEVIKANQKSSQHQPQD